MKKILSAFPIFWIVFFFGLPCLLVLKVSFCETKMASPPFSDLMYWLDGVLNIKINFNHYKALFTHSVYIKSFFSSIILSASSTFIALIIGYSIAYAISCVRSKWRHVLLFFVILPFWTSFLIRIYAWMNLLSYRGIINTFLQYVGIIDSPIRFLDTTFAVGLGIVYCYLPFMILPIYIVLEKVPTYYLEAASDLGATKRVSFFKILLPLSKEGILAGCIMVFLPAMGEFVIPELCGGNTLTVGRVLWWEFFHHLDWPMACALAVMIVVLFVIPLSLLKRIE
jgi:putrescine transport system permease protein